MNISNWEVFVGLIFLLMSGWVISSGIKERSKFWTSLGTVLFMSVAILLTVDYYFDNVEPIEIVEKVDHGFLKYDFGEVGIKAFQDTNGTVIVVSCFQGEGDTTTNCWDHRFQKGQ